MERFWNKVNKTSSCWEWTASSRVSGKYGAFKFKGKVYDAHRFSFYLTHGFFPNNCVLHHCDNPKCVNPFHLYAGSKKQNMNDMMNRGRGNFVSGESVASSKLTKK